VTTSTGLLLPDVPLTLETLQIIFPYAPHAGDRRLAGVDDDPSIDCCELTDTPAAKLECVGRNVITSHRFHRRKHGRRHDCQSVINVKSGGRGQLSALVAGLTLLVLIVFLAPGSKQIPIIWLRWWR
jgi:SulP family sulfate permease